MRRKRCSRRLSSWRGALREAKSSSLASQDGGGVSGTTGADSIERDLQQARDNLVYIEYFPKDAKYVSLFAKRDGDTVDNTDKIAELLKRAKERKQREERAAALRIENMDRRDYDDDDEGQARAGGKGAGDAASRNTSARAENTGAVENTEHATAQAIEGDDFFM